MKRPWLLTQTGQRFSLVIGILLAAIAALSLLAQVGIENQRKVFPLLDTTNVSYCLIQDCGVIEPYGLEIRTVEIQEYKFDSEISFTFINHKRLQGTREVWLRVRNPDGTILEMAKGPIYLSDREAKITFTFTGFPEELEKGSIYLGF